MLKNEKGFTILELLLVVFISSVIVWPLITTLTGNIRVNDLLQDRRSAVGIAESTLYGLDKITYSAIYNQVADANGIVNFDYYIELNSTECVNFVSTADEALCTTLFATIFNNLTLDSTRFRVFIYNYNLAQAEIDALTGPGSLLPAEVKDEISALTASATANPDLLGVTVWIQYHDDPLSILVASGVIFNE